MYTAKSDTEQSHSPRLAYFSAQIDVFTGNGVFHLQITRTNLQIIDQSTNHTKDPDWETLTQRRTISRLCALFKAYSGKRVWKAIHDRLRKTYYLSRMDHVRKIRERKQRTDIGKHSFVNRTIKNWNELPGEALGTFPCKPKIFRNRVRKAITNGVK